MKVTQQLYEEHSEIKKMLQVIKSICNNLENNQSLNQDDFGRVLDFLKVFLDLCHHGKEEKFLFPAMEKAGVQNEGGILEHMLKEHNLGRGYVKALRERYKEVSKGNMIYTKDFIDSGTAFVKLLNHHIDREDSILFPLAEKVLSEESKENLFEDFESVEREVVGPGKHKELEDSLSELLKIYS